MSLISEIQALGADIDDAMQRFMNNTALYEKMLKKFPPACRQTEVESYFRTGNPEAALEAAHTLKGMTGNLSLTPLFTAYSNIVALLREGRTEEAEHIFLEILSVQEEFLSCIEKYILMDKKICP